LKEKPHEQFSSRGQKLKLADLGCGHSFGVDIDIAAPGISVDVSCFGLDARRTAVRRALHGVLQPAGQSGRRGTPGLSGGRARFR
jgi:tellurite resistance protein TerA